MNGTRNESGKGAITESVDDVWPVSVHLHEYQVRGGGFTATANECLEYAKVRMVGVYEKRQMAKEAGSFEEFWRYVESHLVQEPPFNAPEFWDVMGEQFPNEGPRPILALRTAGLYWLYATRELELGRDQCAWPAIVRCNYFIGMASGPMTGKESASAGGTQAQAIKRRIIDPLKEAFRLWLLDQPDKEYGDPAKVISAFAPLAEQYVKAWKADATKANVVNRWTPSYNMKAHLRRYFNKKDSDIQQLVYQKCKKEKRAS